MVKKHDERGDQVTRVSRSAADDEATPAMFRVVNPATGDIVGEAPQLRNVDVYALVDRAREAQPAWAASGFAVRARLVRKLRAWLVRNRHRLVATMMDEAGKTYDDALLEIFVMANALGFWARHSERYLRENRGWARSPLLLGRRTVVRYEPIGVVGVIAPWNYPIILGLGDAIPALMAGNAVVVKPSEATPLSTLLIAEEGLREIGMPPDVCQVATGDGKVGTALVDVADMIMFTGSASTGRLIGARAAERLIPVSLELGGKDPMIVLRDANLDYAADQAVLAGMTNAGQTCMAVERIFVEEPVYDQFLARVVDRVKSLRFGIPGAPGSTDVGALSGSHQASIVEIHVSDAIQRGAHIATGGHRRCNFFEPTVLVDVDPSMACMQEETFGPTLPIMKVRDADEAIALANASDYGLNSSVFTSDVQKGEAIARRLESGACCVNAVSINFMEIAAPFGGWKQSGVGGRHGAEGIRKYCRQQTIMLTDFVLKWNPLGFPRRAASIRIVERAMVALYAHRRIELRPRRAPKGAGLH